MLRNGRGRARRIRAAARARTASLLLGSGAAALLLGASAAAAAPEQPARREIVVLQELTPAFESQVPLAELRSALGALPKGLAPADRIALVVFDAKPRVLQGLDEPVGTLPGKLAAATLCPDGAACWDSDPAAAIQRAVALFEGRPAGADRQILMVSGGAPCQFEMSGPAAPAPVSAPGQAVVRSTRGVNPLEVVKAARAARSAGIRVSLVVFPRERGFVCLPRGGQLDVRGNLILRQYSAAVSGGGPAWVAGEGRSFSDLLAAALATR